MDLAGSLPKVIDAGANVKQTSYIDVEEDKEYDNILSVITKSRFNDLDNAKNTQDAFSKKILRGASNFYEQLLENKL